MTPSSPYRLAAWRRVRLEILERDGWTCQVRLPGCTVRATCVDHIEPWRHGGAWLDPANLRASCQACNTRRSETRPPSARAWSRPW